MSTTIRIIREYTTKNGQRGVVYSFQGRKSATFIPAGVEAIDYLNDDLTEEIVPMTYVEQELTRAAAEFNAEAVKYEIPVEFSWMCGSWGRNPMLTLTYTADSGEVILWRVTARDHHNAKGDTGQPELAMYKARGRWIVRALMVAKERCERIAKSADHIKRLQA